MKGDDLKATASLPKPLGKDHEEEPLMVNPHLEQLPKRALRRLRKAQEGAKKQPKESR